MPVLRQQLVNPRQQPQNQRLQVLGIERLKCLGRHPELESARYPSFNASRLSHTAAEG